MAKGTRFVIGMDLGDRAFQVCAIDRKTGEISAEGSIGSAREDVELFFRPDFDRTQARDGVSASVTR